MVFSSPTFIFAFLPLFFICYFLAKKVQTKNIVLLLFSLVFYAWGEPFYIFLIITSILINYYLTILMDKKKSKTLLAVIVVINIFLLFSFKYANFVIDIINSLNLVHLKNINLSLPIGISFYTFQALSYVIDVYRGKVKVQKKLSNLACYIVAFPQLIAGPIVRYETIEKQLIDRKTTTDGLYIGIKRFIIGLSKKVLIANNVAFIADQIFNQSASTYGFIGALIGIVAYTLQIYYDFSGYSDMAIGLGSMLGFKYDENFNRPYLANSITDFWRRWHISLSSFFKDYVYIPLGGNRVSLLKHIRNILIVWALTGLWHGASWNFVLWGLYYALFLILEKYVFTKLLEKMPNVIRRFITIIIIMFGWILFRFSDMRELTEVILAIVGKYGLGNIYALKYVGIFAVRFIFAFVIGTLFAIVPSIKQPRYDVIYLLLFIICIIFILVGSYNPFIYFRF